MIVTHNVILNELVIKFDNFEEELEVITELGDIVSVLRALNMMMNKEDSYSNRVIEFIQMLVQSSTDLKRANGEVSP